MWNGSVVFGLAAVLALAGCGGGPASPSGAVTLNGVALEDAAGASAAGLSASGARITVTVQEDPSISTTVSINGTFRLTGLPATGFTLVFTRDGVTLGTINVPAVQDATEVNVVVRVRGNTVTLVNLQVQRGQGNGNNNDNQQTQTCMIAGGRVGDRIELEGNVDSGNSSRFKLQVNGNRSGGLVDVTASGATFQCQGDKSNSSTCLASVKAGAKVHVRGTLTSCSGTAAAVAATYVIVQKG